MKRFVFMSSDEINLIIEALREYEERHYEAASQNWQEKMNNLIDMLTKAR